jgi:predicted SAM-dependent methyltransferase
MLTKCYLGCGPLDALKLQDYKILGDMKEWIFVDKFLQGPNITNWDIEDLSEVPDGTLTEIYCSHALEHISHKNVINVLKMWGRKMTYNASILINVPDMSAAFQRIKTLDNDQVPEGMYNQYFGVNGVETILFGTHSQPGEAHLCGFTEGILRYTLEEAGFRNITTHVEFEDHDMECIIAKANK